MIRETNIVSLGVLIALIVIALIVEPGDGLASRRLEYAPAPVDNPLKGLVPYQADVRTMFPHSLEFNYLPYSALARGYDEFDWWSLEKLLDDISSRGHQAIFRIYLEYPGKTGAIPNFLIKDGLKVHKYRTGNTWTETPDYEDKNLRRSLGGFIAALGKKYDGDPRVGFITAGLLGAWGEWHTYPRDELFASKTVQTEVMDAYEAAFKVTPVLVRYPVGKEHPRMATNTGRRFGYHDDSFAWATLDTGKKGDEWFYLTMLKAAGPEAEVKWEKHPVGGEIRPEAWGQVFDEKPENQQVQNFLRCVQETHVTWLMDSGMFNEKQHADRIRRAEDGVRKMGYEFHVPTVTVGDARDGKLAVNLELENRGVAPFYYDWTAEWGLLASGKPPQTFRATGKLSGLLSGEKPRVWSDTLDVSETKPGTYTLAVRVLNPLPGGKPVRFANKTQDADAPSWLSLGRVVIR
ncbi:DUF4832 domain-containing protein [Synechococcus sp. Nb3U1]|uniref:DUF4832 domain-containing protein n=1 Tax=Synechococcus sp. Nb3U1 TaxID=1914529 RepID=UPI001F27E0CB|nr:DUF4832 domain-containing protein [Synechococcus sp. Nb3U1]MCF2969963.1 DUF4832 domain-containing protein [Synechococcus sp. Nb3U1]